MLEIHNLSKRFGSVVGIDGLSFSVQRGEIVSLLGPSGCGKTTTLRLIAGFEQPDAGQIRIDGAELAGKRPYEREVGLLFQSYALFPHMTIRDNIAYGLHHHGWRRPKIRDRVREMLKLVKLDGMDTRFPAQLSGGQQQRVALARALATQPKVILLDEPLSALDAKLRHELRIELKEILRAVNSTTIIVTHDQEEAMGMAERIVVLEQGRLQQVGTPEEIYSRPKNRFVAEFVGRSNWITGICTEHSESFRTITAVDGTAITVPAQATPIEGSYDVGFRPEQVDIIALPEQPAPLDETLLVGTIIDVALLGAERHILVRLSSGRRIMAVQQNRTSTLRVGQEVALQIRASDCIVLPHLD